MHRIQLQQELQAEAQGQVPVELQAQQTALPHPKKTAPKTL